MKVNQLVMTKKEIDIDVVGITLLSKEEYLQAKEYIPFTKRTWWLCSPGNLDWTAACVDGGYVYYGGVSNGLGVRPALKINNPNLSLGDKLEFASHKWTVISDSTALCDDIIGRCAFRTDWEPEDANDYEASDIKYWLENWWNKVKK